MNLKGAMAFAKLYVIYGDPKGISGSFEPIKAHRIKYNDKDAWEITCNYMKKTARRKAKLIIDNYSGDVLEFEIIGMG